MELFPEIGLQRDRFANLPRNSWNNQKNKRFYFENIARRLGKDPLVPETWYSLSRSDLAEFKVRNIFVAPTNLPIEPRQRN